MKHWMRMKFLAQDDGSGEAGESAGQAESTTSGMDFDALINKIYEGAEQAGDSDDGYDLQSESRARQNAAKLVSQNILRDIMADSKKSAGVMKNVATKTAQELKKMSNELAKLKGEKQQISDKLNNAEMRQISEEVQREEEAIMADPYIGPLYKSGSAEIKAYLAEQARHGRVLTQAEATAIKYFYPLAKELARIREGEAARKELMSASLVSRSGPSQDLAQQLAGVQSEDEAMRRVKQNLLNKFGE